MNLLTVQVNSATDELMFSADLVDGTGSSGFRIFETNSTDGVLPANATVSTVGDFIYYGTACISDTALMQADPISALSGLTMPDVSGLSDMSEQAQHIGQVAKDMMAKLPEVNKALDGQMSLTELSGLIDGLQTQLLELNNAYEGIYGHLGSTVSGDSKALEFASVEELLTEAEVAATETMDSVGALPTEAFAPVATHDTTLDALFTHPESFPLTLDFSEPSSMSDAFELFDHPSQSINSSAQPEGGLPVWTSNGSNGESLS